ncbi:hypothetical protein I6E29_07740 [Arcanobacterium haemolyticum]|nr:hypothetical protein [Arcanobacterium haemolyticum]
MYGLRMLGWCTLAALAWLTVIPAAAIAGWALIIAGGLTPLLGAFNLLSRVTGGNGFFTDVFGAMNPVLVFLATFLIGILIAVIGHGIWSIAPATHRGLQSILPTKPHEIPHDHRQGSAFYGD